MTATDASTAGDAAGRPAGPAGGLPAHASWLFVGAVGARLATLVFNSLVARILGPAGFGTVNAATASAGLAASAGTLGVHVGLQRHLALGRSRRAAERGVAGSLALGVLTGAALWLFATPIAAFFGLRHRTDVFVIAAPLATLQVVLAALNGGLAGARQFRWLAMQSVLAGVLTLVAGVGLAVTAGERGVLIAVTLATGGVVGIAALVGHRTIPAGTGASPLWKFLAVGLPVTFTEMAGHVSMWWLLGSVARDAGIQEVAYFRAGQTVGGLVLFVPGSINAAVLSVLSGTNTDRARVRDTTGTLILGIWLVTLPIAVSVACGAPLIVHLLFGPEFLVATISVQVLVWQALLAAVTSVLWQAAVGGGQSVLTAVVGGAWLLATWVVVSTVSIASAGAAAAAYLAVHASATFILIVYGRVSLGIHYGPLVTVTVLTLMLVAVSTAVGEWGAGVPWWGQALVAIAGGATAVGAEWALVLDRDQRTLILGTIRSTVVRA